MPLATSKHCDKTAIQHLKMITALDSELERKWSLHIQHILHVE